ncbi:GNAT family N-acetyltransferase [Tsuneonella sp. HG222]
MADDADDIVVRTPRLLIRRFRDADLAPWQEHLNTPEVRVHLGGEVSREEMAERFARQRDSWNDEQGGWLAVERREDGAFLGYVGFGAITTEAAPEGLRGLPEIGWTLRADAWGQGFATEAARAMLVQAFEKFGHRAVVSQTSEANRGSWRVMERLGMERAVELDYDDPAYPPEENPTKVYRLDRAAWRDAARFRFETDRLVLRDWRQEDWDPFVRHTNTPAVMRWLGGEADAAAQAAFRARVPQFGLEHGHAFWIVERKDDGGHLAGEVLGFCGLKRANMAGGPQGDFEIGWRLREDAWGKGYAKEAALASLRAGFEQFAAPEIIALTIQQNTASWGLMERLGMHRRPELDFRCPDFLPDEETIVYSIDRAAWEARQRAEPAE